MDSPEPPSAESATPDEVRAAIEALTTADHLRLKNAAEVCLYGTEYKNPRELLNETIMRTMNRAQGGQGREWKKTVPFMAFLIKTMGGIANDSSESWHQRTMINTEALAPEGGVAEDALGLAGHCHPGVEELALDAEGIQQRQAEAQADADSIDAHFSGDTEIEYIIMGYKDELSAAEIRDISGMSALEYSTAKTRFRRGLKKISLTRAQS